MRGKAAVAYEEGTSRVGKPEACSMGLSCSLARPVLMLRVSGTNNKGSRETSSSSMSSVVTTPLIVRQDGWSRYNIAGAVTTLLELVQHC